MEKYIYILKMIITKQLADIFLKYVVLQFGILKSIVFNQDFIFISAFWLQLYYCLKIQKKLNIIFYL